MVKFIKSDIEKPKKSMLSKSTKKFLPTEYSLSEHFVKSPYYVVLIMTESLKSTIFFPLKIYKILTVLESYWNIFPLIWNAYAKKINFWKISTFLKLYIKSLLHLSISIKRKFSIEILNHKIFFRIMITTSKFVILDWRGLILRNRNLLTFQL